jgi:RNA polymerase sigma-70 factor, ECF subfamily
MPWRRVAADHSRLTMTSAIVTDNGNDKSPASSGTSRSLIARVQTDEPQAWERLVALYGPLVMHWCRGKGLQGSDAADVFQDVFRSILTGVGRFRKEQKSDTFRGWMRTITQNKIRDHFRKLGREPQGTGGSSAQARLMHVPSATPSEVEIGTDEEAEQSLFMRALELIRSEFEERTWTAFWQTAVVGRAATGVAIDLSMSPGAVRVAKSRVLRRCREELGDLLD